MTGNESFMLEGVVGMESSRQIEWKVEERSWRDKWANGTVEVESAELVWKSGSQRVFGAKSWEFGVSNLLTRNVDKPPSK